MFRSFTLAVPTTYTSIWAMMITAGFINNIGEELVAGVKNDAIIPDRVNQLDCRPADAGSVAITYRDQQADPGVEQILNGFTKQSSRNSICLKDYLFAAASSQSMVVEIESI